MDQRHQFTKSDLWLILWSDLVLFGAMVVIFFLDKKYNILTELVKKFIS